MKQGWISALSLSFALAFPGAYAAAAGNSVAAAGSAAVPILPVIAGKGVFVPLQAPGIDPTLLSGEVLRLVPVGSYSRPLLELRSESRTVLAAPQDMPDEEHAPTISGGGTISAKTSVGRFRTESGGGVGVRVSQAAARVFSSDPALGGLSALTGAVAAAKSDLSSVDGGLGQVYDNASAVKSGDGTDLAQPPAVQGKDSNNASVGLDSLFKAVASALAPKELGASSLDTFVRIGEEHSAYRVIFPIVKDGGNGERLIRYGTTEVEVQLPMIGVFNGDLDDEHYSVTVHSDGFLLSIKVPRASVKALRSDHTVLNALDILSSVKPSFEPGERVRYREANGLMHAGYFREAIRIKKSKKYLLTTDAGENIALPRNAVYKQVNDAAPFTPKITVDEEKLGRWPKFDTNASTLLHYFLISAARLTSHPDFLALSLPAQLEKLMGFIRLLVQPDLAAANGEWDGGLYTFDQVLQVGVGVCRHLATLLAAALAEAGYQVRLMTYVPPGAHEGHAWVEVTANNKDGTAEKYVVDPMGSIILPWNAMLELAQQTGSLAAKMAADWYSQEGRQEVPLLPESDLARVAEVGAAAFSKYADFGGLLSPKPENSADLASWQKRALLSYHEFLLRFSESLDTNAVFIYPYMGPDALPALVRRTFPIEYDKDDFQRGQDMAGKVLGLDAAALKKNLLTREPLDVRKVETYAPQVKALRGRKVLVLKDAWRYMQDQAPELLARLLDELLEPGDMVLALRTKDLSLMEAAEKQGFLPVGKKLVVMDEADDLWTEHEVMDLKALTLPTAFGLWVKR
ncbi:MAG: transglutaminase domain-containing protein [Elusimicrobiota bacterium]|jgi:hypothetical protein